MQRSLEGSRGQWGGPRFGETKFLGGGSRDTKFRGRSKMDSQRLDKGGVSASAYTSYQGPRPHTIDCAPPQPFNTNYNLSDFFFFCCFKY